MVTAMQSGASRPPQGSRLDARASTTERSHVLVFAAYPGLAGSQRMALEVAAALRDAGHRVTVAAPQESPFTHEASRRQFTTRILSASGGLTEFRGRLVNASRARRALVFLRDFLPYQWMIARALRSQGCTAVYAAEERAVLMVGPGARLAGVPVLWHVQAGFMRGSRWMHRLAAACADRLVCVSHAMLEDARAQIGSGGPATSVVWNGIEDLGEPVAPASDPQHLTLLVLGNVVPEKGIHVLAEALDLLPDAVRQRVRVQVAGSLEKDPPFVSYLRERTAVAGAEGRWTFLGFHEKPAELVQAADIVLMPTIEAETMRIGDQVRDVRCKEGFGLSALEGMRAAKPVIASRSYGLREVLGEGAGLLVPPSDRRALAQAIESLVNDPALRARIGAEGRKRFLREFTSTRMRERFVEQFEQLAASRARP